MNDGDDLSDMPMIMDPFEHIRLVGAIKMRFAFLRHQGQLHEATAEAYRAMLSTVTANATGAILFPSTPMLPSVHVQIQNDGGRSMSGANNATNSPGAAVGTGNTAGITGSVVTIGATVTERSAQMRAIDDLITNIKASGLDAEQKADAVRHLENVKEEVDETENPDKGRSARWLERSNKIISLSTAGADLIEKSSGLLRLFGISL